MHGPHVSCTYSPLYFLSFFSLNILGRSLTYFVSLPL